MACGEIHKNDIGTPFEITMMRRGEIVNLSGVSSVILNFVKPNKEILDVTPIFITNGEDGKLQYVFQSGDLDIVGIWRYQVDYTRGSKEISSNIRTFKVYENL